MKNYLLAIIVLTGAFVILPAAVRAQYSNPYSYNGGAYLSRALAYSRANRARHRKHTVRRKRAYRKTHRPAHRISSVETLDFKPDLIKIYRKQSEIV